MVFTAKFIAQIGVVISMLLFATSDFRNYLNTGLAALFLLNYLIIIYCFDKQTQKHLVFAKVFSSFNIIIAVMGFLFCGISVIDYRNDNRIFGTYICISASIYAVFASYVFIKTLKAWAVKEPTIFSTPTYFDGKIFDATLEMKLPMTKQ